MITKRLQEALTEANAKAEAIYRQIWICECGGILGCYTEVSAGSHLVARAFGFGEFEIDDESYVDAAL